MEETKQLSMEELEAGLDWIRRSPSDNGTLELIVRRPRMDEREILVEASLNHEDGLAGDTWNLRRSKRTPDGSPHPDMQITLTNSRLIALLAQTKDRWSLAGDQFYVDLDLSADNLPPGTRLRVGSAVIEVTGQPHTGCDKFAAHFGREAFRFVNAPSRKEMHLRGVNARVVEPGVVKVGGWVTKIQTGDKGTEA